MVTTKFVNTPTTSNLLQSVAGGQTRAFTYDAAGNATYDAWSGVGYGYSYDAANRMACAFVVVKPLGERILRKLQCPFQGRVLER